MQVRILPDAMQPGETGKKTIFGGIMKKITIDGEIFVREADLNEILGQPVLVRCDRSGVFYARIEKREGQEAVLRNARKIWYWSGAASLAQMAIDGVANPDQCKFPEAVSKITVLDVIEILETTEKARKSLEEVPIWKK